MKKLNQKGFTHHLLIFAILALVVGAAGFAGWRIYKNKNIDAQAAGWTVLPSKLYENIAIYKACKKYVNAGSLGQYYEIKGSITVLDKNPLYQDQNYNITRDYKYAAIYVYETTSTPTRSKIGPVSSLVEGVYSSIIGRPLFELWLQDSSTKQGGFPASATSGFKFSVKDLSNCP